MSSGLAQRNKPRPPLQHTKYSNPIIRKFGLTPTMLSFARQAGQRIAHRIQAPVGFGLGELGQLPGTLTPAILNAEIKRRVVDPINKIKVNTDLAAKALDVSIPEVKFPEAPEEQGVAGSSMIIESIFIYNTFVQPRLVDVQTEITPYLAEIETALGTILDQQERVMGTLWNEGLLQQRGETTLGQDQLPSAARKMEEIGQMQKQVQMASVVAKTISVLAPVAAILAPISLILAGAMVIKARQAKKHAHHLARRSARYTAAGIAAEQEVTNYFDQAMDAVERELCRWAGFRQAVLEKESKVQQERDELARKEQEAVAAVKSKALVEGDAVQVKAAMEQEAGKQAAVLADAVQSSAERIVQGEEVELSTGVKVLGAGLMLVPFLW